jgi:cell division protein FtsL
MSLAENVNRKRPEFGLVVALICMALALVIAKYSRQQLLVEFRSSISNGADEAQRPAIDRDGG